MFDFDMSQVGKIVQPVIIVVALPSVASMLPSAMSKFCFVLRLHLKYSTQTHLSFVHFVYHIMLDNL